MKGVTQKGGKMFRKMCLKLGMGWEGLSRPSPVWKRVLRFRMLRICYSFQMAWKVIQ